MDFQDQDSNNALGPHVCNWARETHASCAGKGEKDTRAPSVLGVPGRASRRLGDKNVFDGSA